MQIGKKIVTWCGRISIANYKGAKKVAILLKFKIQIFTKLFFRQLEAKNSK